MNDQDIKTLWRAQPAPAATITLDQIQQQAGKFHRTISRRNRIEEWACFAVMLIFGIYAWLLPGTLMRIGSALVVLGSVVILHQLRTRASVGAPPAGSLARSHVEYMRAELGRQRDALRSVWLWYVGPTVPGLVVFVWGLADRLGPGLPWQIPVMFVVPFLVVIWMNVAAARALQRRIDALDAVA